ncbi:hypothetical protein R3J22_03775 [Trueperella bernardiae]|uniref:hypothetical protein n=1 Tax=Trueperella bernardiae TaxID=59561 RepID=UPI0029492025|nr:hypothetical protein [Trueperella bernardiae]MDV6238648.1 hypothetical protein [Trueperella bernardiae]
MNPYRKDRADLIDALNTTGYTVDDTQPEIIDCGTILIDDVSYEWADIFENVKATYAGHVVLDAFDAESANAAHADAVAAIWDALANSDAGDIETAGALINLTDGAGRIFPAFPFTITSLFTTD